MPDVMLLYWTAEVDPGRVLALGILRGRRQSPSLIVIVAVTISALVCLGLHG